MIISKRLRFEWDKEKEKTNVKKHGVSFIDAAQVFTMRMHWLYMTKIIHTMKKDM